MKREFSSQIKSNHLPQNVANFIKVKSNDGLNLKTFWFPAKLNKPHSTIFFIHSYGSYLEKYAPVMEYY